MGDLEVAYRAESHLGEAGDGRAADGAQEVLGVEFEEVCIRSVLLTPSSGDLVIAEAFT